MVRCVAAYGVSNTIRNSFLAALPIAVFILYRHSKNDTILCLSFWKGKMLFVERKYEPGTLNGCSRGETFENGMETKYADKSENYLNK